MTDSSETGLGLLSVGNEEGRLYWLVNDHSKIVERTTFLAYGKLESIPALDFFNEYAMNSHIEAACSADLNFITDKANSELEEDYLKIEHFTFLKDLQQKMLHALPHMKVAPPPEKGKETYKRKDKKDMDEQDLAWLPLTAPKKIAKAEPYIHTCIKERGQLDPKLVSLYNIRNDLEIQLKFDSTIETEKIPTLIAFVEENLRSQLHPQISVNEVQS